MVFEKKLLASWILSLLPLLAILGTIHLQTQIRLLSIVCAFCAGIFATLVYLTGHYVAQNLGDEYLIIIPVMGFCLVCMMSLYLAMGLEGAGKSGGALERRLAACVSIHQRGDAKFELDLEGQSFTAEKSLPNATQLLWTLRFVALAFTVGALSGWFSSLAANEESALGTAAILAYLSAGFCEELLKALFAGLIPRYLLADRRTTWWLAIIATLGFTTVENFLYLIMTNDIPLLCIRSLFVIPLHAGWCTIASAGIVRQRRGFWWCLEAVAGFVTAVGLHGTYDFCLYSNTKTWESLAFVSTVMLTSGIVCTLWNTALPLKERPGARSRLVM